MSAMDERPPLASVRAQRPFHVTGLAAGALVIGVTAFVAGWQLAPGGAGTGASRSPASTSAAASSSTSGSSTTETIAVTASPTTTSAAPAPTPTSQSSSLTIPNGSYHVTLTVAYEIGAVADFYEAFNSHDIAKSMALLSDNPVVEDCDYRTESLVSIKGRGAVESYLQQRATDHDRWSVELYQERPPDPRQVVIVPRVRENDTLAELGALDRRKTKFGVLLSIQFARDERHIDTIEWASVMGPTIVKELCSA